MFKPIFPLSGGRMLTLLQYMTKQKELDEGHEVPGVVAVLCESLGLGGYKKRDMPRMRLSVPFVYHLALRCKSCKTKQNKATL